jgi:hypothetical protein
MNNEIIPLHYWTAFIIEFIAVSHVRCTFLHMHVYIAYFENYFSEIIV